MVLFLSVIPWYNHLNRFSLFQYKNISNEVITKEYYDDFKQDLIKRGFSTNKLDNMKIYIGHGMSIFSFTAYCEDMHLDINKRKYLSLSKLEQKRIFYHELGHCLYNYKHRNHGIMSYSYEDINQEELDDFFNPENGYLKFDPDLSIFSIKERILQHYENEELLYGHEFSPILYIIRIATLLLLIGLFFLSFSGYLITKMILLKREKTHLRKDERNKR